MVPTSNFEKLSSKLEVIEAILYNLDAPLPRIELCPGISIQFVILLTSMTCI